MPKEYYIPGVDDLHQLEETPQSRARTEQRRFVITTAICVVSAVASIVAAVASILALIR